MLLQLELDEILTRLAMTNGNHILSERQEREIWTDAETIAQTILNVYPNLMRDNEPAPELQTVIEETLLFLMASHPIPKQQATVRRIAAAQSLVIFISLNKRLALIGERELA